MKTISLQSVLGEVAADHAHVPHAYETVRAVNNEILNDARFQSIHPYAVRQHIGNVLNEEAYHLGIVDVKAAAERIYNLSVGTHNEFVSDHGMPAVKLQPRASEPKITPKPDAFKKSGPKYVMPDPHNPETLVPEARIGGSALSSQQKFWGGMSLLGAALNLFFAYDSAKHIRKTNPMTGKQETQWSQVGITVLNASLAAGLGYVGAVELMRGRA